MKNINLELYKIFYEVGRQKSITKASNSLFISQPAITKQIQKLEMELDYKLFYRTKYGVEFTKEGEKLFKEIESAMKSLENAPDYLDSLNDVISNLVIVSSYGSASMVVAPKIPDIVNLYPDINISVDKLNNEEIIKALLNNSANIGIINDKSINTENIAYYDCLTVERIFVATPEYLKEHPIKKITLKNLDKYPIISTGKTSTTRRLFEEYLAKNCLSITPKIDIDSYEIALDLISKGMGISVFNKPYIAEMLKSRKASRTKNWHRLSNKTSIRCS